VDVANEASVIASLDGREDGFVNSARIGRDAPFFETLGVPDEIAVAALFLILAGRQEGAFCPQASQRRWRLRRGRMSAGPKVVCDRQRHWLVGTR
jgi:hypothetical protein